MTSSVPCKRSSLDGPIRFSCGNTTYYHPSYMGFRDHESLGVLSLDPSAYVGMHSCVDLADSEFCYKLAALGGFMSALSTTTAGINGAWSMYRQCAATSSFQKSQLEMFLKISLWLGIAGAVIGTVGHVVWRDQTSVPSRVLGTFGSLTVALAGLAATQAAARTRDKFWIRCRAAGEALKSSVYLYSASVPPFDVADRASTLAQRVEKALKDLEGIELRPGKPDKLPPGPLSVTDYIKVRLDDQISFYTNSAIRYQKKADFWRYAALGGAALSAVLGAISAIFSLSAWVALLATLTTSITAYVKNQRYELMIGLYQATAMRLQLLKDQWLDSGKSDADKEARDSFIQRCEETMALENGAWVAQWSQQPTSPNNSNPHDQAAQPQSGAPHKDGIPVQQQPATQQPESR